MAHFHESLRIAIVAIRIEIRPEVDTYERWLAFYNSDPEAFLQGNDWAFLLDRQLLIEQVSERIKDGIGNASKFRLNSGPSTAWGYSSGQPALATTLEGEAVDACPALIDDLDMDVRVDIRTEFLVPQRNILRTTYHLDAEPSSTLEEIYCAVTVALLWPFVGLILFDRDEINFGGYLAGLAIGPIPLFVGAIIAAETKSPPDISKELGNDCRRIGDNDFECNENVNLQIGGLGGKFNLDSVNALLQGLFLSGGVTSLPELSIGKISTISIKPFEWEIEGNCRQKDFKPVNRALIGIGFDTPAKLCVAVVTDDPLQEFVLTLKDFFIRVEPRFLPDYVANPYPCRIKIITTVGIRSITLDPPTQKTNQDQERLEGDRIRAIASCYRWERTFTKIEQIKWLIDPPDVQRHIQVWQIAVSKLLPDESINVRDKNDVLLVSASGTERGNINFSLSFDSPEVEQEIFIELNGERPELPESREIAVTQTLYVYRASVPMRGQVTEFSFETEAERNLLQLSMGDQVKQWDITAPDLPIPLSSFLVPREKEEFVATIHTGRRITSSLTLPKLHEFLANSPDIAREATYLASPKVPRFKTTLFLGSEQGGRLLNISSLENSQVIQEIYQRPWFEGTATSGKLLAKLNPENNAVDIFEAITIKEI